MGDDLIKLEGVLQGKTFSWTDDPLDEPLDASPPARPAAAPAVVLGPGQDRFVCLTANFDAAYFDPEPQILGGILMLPKDRYRKCCQNFPSHDSPQATDRVPPLSLGLNSPMPCFRVFVFWPQGRVRVFLFPCFVWPQGRVRVFVFLCFGPSGRALLCFRVFWCVGDPLKTQHGVLADSHPFN